MVIENLKALPEPLQKQVISRFCAGVVFLLLMALIWILSADVYFGLPCLLLSGFLLLSGGQLFYTGCKGSYICIRGICEQIDTCGIRKRIKSIDIAFDGHMVKIPIRQRMKRRSIGDTVIVYLSEKTPVYERDGVYMICSYYTLEAEKRCEHSGCK